MKRKYLMLDLIMECMEDIESDARLKLKDLNQKHRINALRILPYDNLDLQSRLHGDIGLMFLNSVRELMKGI